MISRLFCFDSSLGVEEGVEEREEHTTLETENTQAEIMLDYINKELKKMGESV